MTIEDNAVAADGLVKYTLVCGNESGEGLSASAYEYVGFDRPLPIGDVAVALTEEDGVVEFSWDPVTTDVRGHSYQTGDVHYIFDTPVGKLTSETSPFRTRIVADGQQKVVHPRVYTSYKDKMTYGGYIDEFLAGTPYSMVRESFSEVNTYIWQNYYNPTERGSGGWAAQAGCNNVRGLSFTDPGGDMLTLGYSFETYDSAASIGESAMLTSGILRFGGEHVPGLSFWIYNSDGCGKKNLNELNVYVYCLDDPAPKWKLFKQNTVSELCRDYDSGNIEAASDWNRVFVPLDEYVGKRIRVGLECVYKGSVDTYIDNLMIGDLDGKDLAAKLHVPDKVRHGRDYTVNVVVSNKGFESEGECRVDVYKGEELTASKYVVVPEADKTVTVPFVFNMPVDSSEALEYRAEVIYEGDSNTDNNTTGMMRIEPTEWSLPGATELEASSSDGKVTLEWSKPIERVGVGMPILESFESGNNMSAYFKDWTFYDRDEGAASTDMPEGSPARPFWQGAFCVMADRDGYSDEFLPHSGEKALLSWRTEGCDKVDDWAISPELDGTAQSVSFYAKSYSDEFSERIAVYASQNSSQMPYDFDIVDGTTVEAVPSVWTKYETIVPAGTSHFAVRRFGDSATSMTLMIDDVEYIPVENVAADLEGYNIYRDGRKINSSTVTSCSFSDIDVEDGCTYEYYVKTVYTGKGETAESNHVNITADLSGINDISETSVSVYAGEGCIIVANAEGLSVEIYTLSGISLHRDSGSELKKYSVLPGVYLVRVGSRTLKLCV